MATVLVMLSLHWYSSMPKTMTGFKACTLHQEKFNISPYNLLEGFIHFPSFDRPLLILGRENINHSVHGDQVVVRVMYNDQRKQPFSNITEEGTMAKNDNLEVEQFESIETGEERRPFIGEAKMSQGAIGGGGAQPTARVDAIKRNWRYCAGHIDPSSAPSIGGGSQRNVFLIPMDKKIPQGKCLRCLARGLQYLSMLGIELPDTLPVISSGRWER